MEWHVWRAGARKATESCLDSTEQCCEVCARLEQLNIYTHLHFFFTMDNDLPITVTTRAVGASNPDAGGPPPNVMPLHAPRCKSLRTLHATASTALKYEAHASTADNCNCRSFRTSDSSRSSGFSSNAMRSLGPCPERLSSVPTSRLQARPSAPRTPLCRSISELSQLP